MNQFQERMTAYGADVDTALKRCADDAELYETCVRLFAEDAEFPALRRAVEASDLHAAFEAAHALKGVAANLSLTPLYNAICAIVEPLRRGEARDYLPLLERVEAEQLRLQRQIAPAM